MHTSTYIEIKKKSTQANDPRKSTIVGKYKTNLIVINSSIVITRNAANIRPLFGIRPIRPIFLVFWYQNGEEKRHKLLYQNVCFIKKL